MKNSGTLLLLLSFSLNVPACSENKSDPFVATAETDLNETTDASGSTSATYDPEAKTDQSLSVSQSNLATSGVKVLLKPGALAVSTSIFIEEGLSPVGSISTDLGITETAEKESNPIVVRTDDETIIPAQPLTLAIPTFSSALHLADKQLTVFYIAYTKDGQKAGLIAPSQVSLVGNKALFKTAYFGVYQLAFLSTLPEKTEASSSEKVSVKPPPVKAPSQTVYIVGKQDAKAGYWKDGTWTELSIASQGISEANALAISDKAVLYVSGSTEEKTTGTGSPGYWKDGTWNPLKIPTGFESCGFLRLLLAGGSVHIAGNCAKANAGGLAAIYWKDGTVTNLPNTLTNGTTSRIAGISVDAAGLVSITGELASATEKSAGYWKDAKWVELEKKALDAIPGPALPEGPRIFDAAGKDHILANNGTQRGYWQENKFNASEYFLSDLFLSSTSDLYLASSTAAKFGFFKNTEFTAIAKPKDARETNGQFLRVAKGGEIYLTGDYTDATGRTIGYWKDGTFAALKEKTDAAKDAIFDIVLY